MSETPTPETDKEASKHDNDDCWKGMVFADFARKLERERDEARLEAERLRKDEYQIDLEQIIDQGGNLNIFLFPWERVDLPCSGDCGRIESFPKEGDYTVASWECPKCLQKPMTATEVRERQKAEENPHCVGCGRFKSHQLKGIQTSSGWICIDCCDMP